MLQSSWEEHENTLCIGVNWDIFADVDQAKVGYKKYCER